MPKKSVKGGVWPFDIFQNPDVPKEGIVEKITKVKDTIGKVKNKIKAKFRKKPPALDTQVYEPKPASPNLMRSMYPRLDPVAEPPPLYQAPPLRRVDPIVEPLPLYQVAEPPPLDQAPPLRRVDPVAEPLLYQAPRREGQVADNMRPPGYAGGRRKTRRNKKTKPKSKSKKRR
jgi:hypothetical protein